MLVSGVSVLGETEPRLIQLARSLNGAGIRVAVPILTGLKALRFEQEDLEIVRACLRYLLKSFGQAISMMAFSAGGSIALTLSAETEFASRIRFMALFSPVYDPHETWQIVDRIARTPIVDLQDADDEIWIHMVNAYRNAMALGFTLAEKEAMLVNLQRYTHGLTTAEKIAFHQNVTARRPMNGHQPLDEHEALNAISPVGRLGTSTARIVIIYDAHDFVVPVSQMQALAAELSQRTPPDFRLLITPALSHVTLRPKYLFDVLTMVDMIGELFP